MLFNFHAKGSARQVSSNENKGGDAHETTLKKQRGQ